MNLISSLDLLLPDNDALIPKAFLECIQQHRLTHALLFCSAAKTTQAFLRTIAAFILCHEAQSFCRNCPSCSLMMHQTHPDVTLIRTEKKREPIKIQQIRDSLEMIYLSPKLGHNRVIIIEAAEKLNPAAANALLKVLEEPPAGVYFILSASHISSLLPTILSRCQIWRLDERAAWCDNYEAFTQNFLEPSQDALDIINDLKQIMEQRVSLFQVASQWQTYDLSIILNELFMIYAFLIRAKMSQTQLEKRLIPLQQLSLSTLFAQFQYLSDTLEKISHNMNVNGLLTIENFLFYLEQR